MCAAETAVISPDQPCRVSSKIVAGLPGVLWFFFMYKNRYVVFGGIDYNQPGKPPVAE